MADTRTAGTTWAQLQPFAGFPDFRAVLPSYPFGNYQEQLMASLGTPSMGPYARFGGAQSTGGGAGGILGGGYPGAGKVGTSPAPGNADPGFGAAPSSAAFPNLTDADKAYLWSMKEQYRTDLKNQPGAHQLFFDLYGGKYSPEQINALINDIGYNNPLIGQGFNPSAYTGPLASQYAALVRGKGGTLNLGSPAPRPVDPRAIALGARSLLGG